MCSEWDSRCAQVYRVIQFFYICQKVKKKSQWFGGIKSVTNKFYDYGERKKYIPALNNTKKEA